MNEYAVKWKYGTEPGTIRDTLQYFKSLKIIVGADGVVSEPEMAALKSEMEALGTPVQLVEEIVGFDFMDANLDEHLPIQAGRSHVRMLLYDAIRIANADGVYHHKERDAVAAAAELLRVEPAMARAIEGLVNMEYELTAVRHALFSEE